MRLVEKVEKRPLTSVARINQVADRFIWGIINETRGSPKRNGQPLIWIFLAHTGFDMRQVSSKVPFSWRERLFAHRGEERKPITDRDGRGILQKSHTTAAGLDGVSLGSCNAGS